MTILVEKLLIQLKNVDVLQELVCHSKLNLIAVVANELSFVGLIYLFAESAPAAGSPWKCPSKPLAIKWHPSQPTLVIGCESGELFALSVESKVLKEVRLPLILKDAEAVQSPLKFLRWANENQLLTLDLSGGFTVWNYSRDGEFQPLGDYEVKDTPSKMVVLHSTLWECFIACTSGFIYQIVQGNLALTEAFQLDKTILNMVSYEDTSLCVLTIGGVFSVFRRTRSNDISNGESTLQLVNTVKMSGRSKFIQMEWLNRDLLALTGGDLTIRLWNFNSNDTFILPLPDSSDTGFHSGAEYFTTIAYRHSSILSAATNLGGIAFWRYHHPAANSNPEDDWSFMGLVSLTGGSLSRSAWCCNMLYIHNGSTLFQVVEQHPCVAYENHIGVVQVSSSVVSIQKGKSHLNFDLPFKIAGVDLCSNHVLVWGDGKIGVYQLATGPTNSNEKPFSVGQFECSCSTVRLFKTACFCLEGTLIQMRSFQGSLLATLSFMDSEGSPILIDLSAHYLCAASSSGFIKLWDVSNKDPKLHVSTKNVAPQLTKFTSFRSLKCNSDASCISFTVKDEEKELFIWRTAWNLVESFNVATEWQESDDDDVTLGAHHWDEEEPRIVICQLKNGLLDKSGLVSIFVPADQQELLVQDVVSLTDTDQLLIGVHLPQFVVLNETAHVTERELGSLAGLDDRSDKATRDAILSFSCHLRRGRVEQAYQAVRSFSSPKIWQGLARSCVQLRRPDVGLICLGKLGNARAAAAVRHAHTKYPDQPEAVTAVLAVQLGMVIEAEELCEHSGCYELLSRMYQSSNRWENALQLAHTKDRINLKRTYYYYARHLESEGKTDLAKEMYEKCKTHHYDVPRMLFDDTSALQNYCTTGQDPEKLRWWAQFLESSGEMEAALEHYARAGDYLSLVRLHCYLGDLERATELAEQSQDPAACFHVARQHESNDNISDALKFFGQAGAFGNAVRLCKEHELGDQLYRYAMQGDQEEMIEAARYFESTPASGDRQPHFDRAVMLYSKAGLVDTALDLASRTEQHEAVLELARRLDRNSNPASLQRCANYLATHKHYDTAVDLLAMAGKQSEAIEMCLNYNVKLTESLADQLMGSHNGTVNNHLLTQLAEAAQRQGDYQLAAKKFTQSGDKFQAMKALLKSGETDRIIFFANVSREADIYILAGNYLQTLDWRSHPEYVKHIVTFYSKAKSSDLLIGFYEACAQVEIDEFRNYESALNAMREAYKIASKNADINNQSTRARVLLVKIDFLDQFTRLCNECQTDPKKIAQLEGVLKSNSLELGILKTANIYSAIFHLQMEHKMNREALTTLNAMKATIPNFMHYLNYESVSHLCSTMNIPPSTYITQETNDEEDNTEEIKERIMIRER